MIFESEVPDVHFEDICGHGRLEQQRVQEVPAVVDFGCPHGIQRGLGKSVVAQVVPRYKGARGVPIGQRQRVAPQSLAHGVRESSTVHRIMGDTGPGKGKVTEHEGRREAAEGSEGKGVVPRSGGEDEIERDPEDAAPVLRVAEDGFSKGLCHFFKAVGFQIVSYIYCV